METNQIFDRPIAAFGVPRFPIPSIIIVSPSLSLEAIVELDITLAGQTLIGVGLNISNLSATVDLVDGSNSRSSNLVPRATPFFNARAQISATLVLGLPFSLGNGFQRPQIKFKNTTVLTEFPSPQAALNSAGDATNNGTDPVDIIEEDEDEDEQEDKNEDEEADKDIETDETIEDCINAIGYNLKCELEI